MARLLKKDPPACTVGALEIRAPWLRAAVGDSGTAGGYLAVTNTAAMPDRLLSASSPASSRLAIHAIRVVGGDIAMRPLGNGLVLPPETTLTLKPRGYHLLLGGVTQPLVKGGRVPITLDFEGAGRIEVEFSIEEPGPVGDQTLFEMGQPG